MVYSILVRGDCISVVLSGTYAGGPVTTNKTREIVRVLREAMSASKATRVVIDCRDLRYSGGDAISWLWVAAHKEGLDCSVRADGETKALLSELMDIGLRVPITD